MTRTPTQSRIAVNGVELALFEWTGDGPPLLFVHANSFHARCWDQVIARLPEYHCYAIDQRGHGRSSKPAPPYRWRSLGEDVAALGCALGLRGAIGIGHSLGGFAVTLGAALAPELFAALLLLDPVILPQSSYAESFADEQFTARRRNHWESPAAMYARFKDRRPFKYWKPAVLRDYCDYGLLPAPDGHGYVLACPPAVEANFYAAWAGGNIYPEIATIDIPVQVVRGGQHRANPVEDLSASPTAPDLAAHFRRGRDIHLPDNTHFIPMESPALVAGYVREIARSVGSA
ncbi:MAG TPA: alpha/beta hydrolase [Roseiflexaceae bacterium]